MGVNRPPVLAVRPVTVSLCVEAADALSLSLAMEKQENLMKDRTFSLFHLPLFSSFPRDSSFSRLLTAAVIIFTSGSRK